MSTGLVDRYARPVDTEPTSAGRVPKDTPGKRCFVVYGLIPLTATGASTGWTTDNEPWPELTPTNSGQFPVGAKDSTEDTSTALMNFRRLSGLTWEQMEKLFGVSRRSLHFWASGKPMNAGNEEHLRRILAAVRTTDRGSAAENRAMLLQDRDDVIPLDLLADRRYDDFVGIVGRGPGRQAIKLAPLSQAARDARRPIPPEKLVGALQDTVHVQKGRFLGATPIRAKREP